MIQYELQGRYFSGKPTHMSWQKPSNSQPKPLRVSPEVKYMFSKWTIALIYPKYMVVVNKLCIPTNL